MLISTFRMMRPEFDTADDVLVQRYLNEAALQLDEAVYGTKYDQAQGLLAAHLIAMSPFGYSARLQDGQGDTSIYWPEFAKLRRQVAPRFIVL